MTHYLWFATIPVWIFIMTATARLALIFCADRIDDRWWSFPLWMAIGTSLFAATIAGMICFAALGAGVYP